MCHARSLENRGLRGKFVKVRRVHLCASVTRERVRSLLVRQERTKLGFRCAAMFFRSRTKSALTNLCNHLALAAAFAATAEWRAISLSARRSNSFPGAILCQGDAR